MTDQQNRSNHINRREFVTRTGAALALGLSGLSSYANPLLPTMQPANIRIKNVSSNFEREPLFPYRFKGSAITESWQVAAFLEGESGISKVGLGTQGVLWSDARVAAAHSENGGNALMYAMSERALQLMKGSSFTNPVELLDKLLPEVYAYGKKITNNPDLRKTFALNALVCVDNAAWLLYAAENKIQSFDALVPAAFRPGLSYRHEKVASIPSFPVGSKVEDIKAAADKGHFIMKLKTGSAGTQKKCWKKTWPF
jgi:hypothetical protein